MSFEDTLNRHNDCQVVIIERLHKGKFHPVPGLYCESHGCLIKWLSTPAFTELIAAGVENLGMLKDEENTYLRRKRLLIQNQLFS